MRLALLLAVAAPLVAQSKPAEWGLVYDIGEHTRVRVWPSGVTREVAASLAGGAPAVRMKIGSLTYETHRTDSIVSPDGKHIVHVLASFVRAARNGEIVVSDGEGNDPRLLTSTGLHNDYPVWFPDSRRLLYQRQQARDGKVVREVVVHHLADDRVELFADQAVAMPVRPVFLPDGRLLYIRVQQTEAGPSRALVAAREGGSAQVILAGCPPIEELAAGSDGTVLARGRDRLLSIDLVTGAVRTLSMTELADPSWQVELAKLYVRPDRGAVAICFKPPDPRSGDAGSNGEQYIAVLEPLAEPWRVTRFELGRGARLRRWCTAAELDRARIRD